MEKKRERLERTVAYLRLRDGEQCFYCGKPMEFDRPPECQANWNNKRRASVEHLIDRSKGGTRHHTNAVLAHRKCNSDRSQMALAEKLASRSFDAPKISRAVENTIRRPDLALAEMLDYRKAHGQRVVKSLLAQPIKVGG